MAAPAKPLDACVDTCVLINFALVGGMNLLAQIADLVFHVPQEVLNEITSLSRNGKSRQWSRAAD